MEDSANSSLLLGFCNSKYSDCTIILRFEKGTCVLASDEADKRVGHEALPLSPRPVPASSLVLAAKSIFFRSMFDGGFAEGVKRGEVAISLPEDGESPFMELLRFMYAGRLQPSVATGFHATLRVLILADKFDCPECVAACTEALTRLQPIKTVTDALLLISLPDPITSLPALGSLIKEAQDRLALDLGKHLSPSSSQDALFSLSEVALGAILESQLPLRRIEDDVVASARKWVLKKHPREADQHEATCRLVIPRIRFLALSPSGTKQVCDWWTQASCFYRERAFASSCTTLAGSTMRQLTEEKGGYCSGPEGLTQTSSSDILDSVTSLSLSRGLWQAEKAISKALVEYAELRQIRTGVVPAKTQCAEFRRQQPQQQQQQQTLFGPPSNVTPQLVVPAIDRSNLFLYAEPIASVYLDIPHSLAMNFHFRSPLAASPAAMLLPHRWFVLKARAELVTHLLSFALVLEPTMPSKSGVGDTVLCIRFCIRSSKSSPGFEQVSELLVHRFNSLNPEATQLNALGRPFATALQESDVFFPEGAMHVRADIWNVMDF